MSQDIDPVFEMFARLAERSIAEGRTDKPLGELFIPPHIWREIGKRNTFTPRRDHRTLEQRAEAIRHLVADGQNPADVIRQIDDGTWKGAQ